MISNAAPVAHISRRQPLTEVLGPISFCRFAIPFDSANLAVTKVLHRKRRQRCVHTLQHKSYNPASNRQRYHSSLVELEICQKKSLRPNHPSSVGFPFTSTVPMSQDAMPPGLQDSGILLGDVSEAATKPVRDSREPVELTYSGRARVASWESGAAFRPPRAARFPGAADK